MPTRTSDLQNLELRTAIALNGEVCENLSLGIRKQIRLWMKIVIKLAEKKHVLNVEILSWRFNTNTLLVTQLEKSDNSTCSRLFWICTNWRRNVWLDDLLWQCNQMDNRSDEFTLKEKHPDLAWLEKYTRKSDTGHRISCLERGFPHLWKQGKASAGCGKQDSNTAPICPHGPLSSEDLSQHPQGPSRTRADELGTHSRKRGASLLSNFLPQG